MKIQQKTLGEVTAPRIDQAGPDAAEFTYIDIGSIDRETKRILEPKVLPKAKAPSRAKQRLKTGDVLVSMTRPNLNAVALVPPTFDGAIGSTGFHVLRSHGAVPAYLFYAVQSPAFVDAMCRKVQGALYPAVRPRDIAGYSVPLPDESEQRRIVAEIEKQFTRLDAGVAALRRVQANLKRYRAAVLKAACEGRLVPTEAELGRNTKKALETGESLFARIVRERDVRWGAKKKPTSTPSPDKLKLLNLPEGWTWSPLSFLGIEPANTVQTGPFGAQLHNTEFTDTGVPVIAVGNLTGTGFTSRGLYFVSEKKAKQLARYDVQAGDLLFARSGATLGKVCVAPPGVRDWRMTGHILRARLNPAFIDSRLVVYALAAFPAVKNQVLVSVRGVTRPGFNTSLLESIYVPVPPLAEQKRIIAEVERLLSVIDGLEAVVTANLARAIRLRQAILQRAFSN